MRVCGTAIWQAVLSQPTSCLKWDLSPQSFNLKRKTREVPSSARQFLAGPVSADLRDVRAVMAVDIRMEVMSGSPIVAVWVPS
jgi:hypothetical protein